MGILTSFLILVSVAIFAFVVQNRFLSTPKPLPNVPKKYFGTGDKKPDNTKIVPFKINVADSTLEDLQTRLSNARWFDSLEDSPNFDYGFNTAFLRTVQKHWREQYDWRKWEKTINAFPQYKTEVQGLMIHYLHVKPSSSKYKQTFPLLLVHGWPGSIFEFYKILPILTDPRAHKIDVDFAFEVIAPSIPGYGYSDAPKKTGFGTVHCGTMFGSLMTRLGFQHYYLQGGDWGSAITTDMAVLFPERAMGLHINMAMPTMNDPMRMLKTLIGYYMPQLVMDPADVDKVYPVFKQLGFTLQESGYFHIQATKPDTVGFALNDSPMGLAAYIMEKFSTWTNRNYKSLPDGGLGRHWTMDELLTNVMIYWTTGSIASSQRFYKESFASEYFADFNSAPVTVPTGVAMFPNELLRTPRSFLTTRFPNITHYQDMKRGGHFGAFEEPQLLAEDVFIFVKELRAAK